MSITDIEKEIRKLPTNELNELMNWFANYHAEIWDKQIEDDVDNGRFDGLFAEIDSEINSGLAKPL